MPPATKVIAAAKSAPGHLFFVVIFITRLVSEGFAPFIGEVLGVKTAAIEYRAEGKRCSIRLGDIAEAEIDGLPGADGNDVTVANAPFATDPGVSLVVAKSQTDEV
jgi:hypothetical protein